MSVLGNQVTGGVPSFRQAEISKLTTTNDLASMSDELETFIVSGVEGRFSFSIASVAGLLSTAFL